MSVKTELWLFCIIVIFEWFNIILPMAVVYFEFMLLIDKLNYYFNSEQFKNEL